MQCMCSGSDKIILCGWGWPQLIVFQAVEEGCPWANTERHVWFEWALIHCSVEEADAWYELAHHSGYFLYLHRGRRRSIQHLITEKNELHSDLRSGSFLEKKKRKNNLIPKILWVEKDTETQHQCLSFNKGKKKWVRIWQHSNIRCIVSYAELSHDWDKLLKALRKSQKCWCGKDPRR